MKKLTQDQRLRRERILSSTRDQLSRTGYEGINMRDLAVQAEVSTATLYNLYQSKDALILAALEDLLVGLNNRALATATKGVEQCIARLEILSHQIVSTPKYAEAMARMLFTAEASDPIVRLVISAPAVQHGREIREMIALGEIDEHVDVAYISRSLAATGWAVILLWMKGFIALHDFEREYMRSSLNVILPWLRPDQVKRCRVFF